jgi:hypothetical protein
VDQIAPLHHDQYCLFPFILLSNVYRIVAFESCSDRETSQCLLTIQIATYLWVIIVIVCVS